MKFKTTMMIVSVFLLFSCESKPQETSQPISEEKTSQIIDNTKARVTAPLTRPTTKAATIASL